MTEETPRTLPLRLGDAVPDFEANSTHGPIKMSDYKGKWVVLFSHPADFTPVCTTEFAEFARRSDEFEARGVKLIGNSIDSVFSHIAWVRDIEKKHDLKVPFPVIADLDQKVARLYGMVHEPMAATATVRCVFFIGPEQTLRALIYYPLSLGRNMDEIIRVIDGLQIAEANACATPVNWKPGDPVIVPPPATYQDAEAREKQEGIDYTDWYLSRRTL